MIRGKIKYDVKVDPDLCFIICSVVFPIIKKGFETGIIRVLW